MFSSCSQVIRAHSQLIQAERLRYSHLIRVENSDVLKHGLRYSQVATPIDNV